MWPFTRSKLFAPIPKVRCGDVVINWGNGYNGWEFTIEGTHFTLHENPVFDTRVISKIGDVRRWLVELEPLIDKEIEKELEGLCPWNGQKDLVEIDVSDLADKDMIDVCYVEESWGDLGINIVIVSGEIKGSYSGD